MPITIGSLVLYSLRELSEKTGLTEITLRAYARKGKIRGRKLGTRWYFPEDSIREYFEAGQGNRETKVDKDRE